MIEVTIDGDNEIAVYLGDVGPPGLPAAQGYGSSVPGLLSTTGVFLAFIPVTEPFTLTKGVALAMIPATGAQAYELRKWTAGTSVVIGSIVFAPGAYRATVTLTDPTTAFVVGDAILIPQNGGADATLAGAGFSFS